MSIVQYVFFLFIFTILVTSIKPSHSSIHASDDDSSD